MSVTVAIGNEHDGLAVGTPTVGIVSALFQAEALRSSDAVRAGLDFRKVHVSFAIPANKSEVRSVRGDGWTHLSFEAAGDAARGAESLAGIFVDGQSPEIRVAVTRFDGRTRNLLLKRIDQAAVG